MKNRIVIKSSKAGMTVILDPECSFEDLIGELAAKFKDSARFWGNAQMALLLQGRELTAAQEMQIVNTITENSGIEVLCLLDQDLDRVERCEKALNQKLMELSERTGQFYRGDLHRGEEKLPVSATSTTYSNWLNSIISLPVLVLLNVGSLL